MLMSTLFHNFILTTEKHLLSVFSSNWFFFFSVCVCLCADQEAGDGSSSGGGCVGAQGFSIRASPKTTPRWVHTHTQIPSPALPHHLHSSLVPLLHPSPPPPFCFSLCWPPHLPSLPLTPQTHTCTLSLLLLPLQAILALSAIDNLCFWRW